MTPAGRRARWLARGSCALLGREVDFLAYPFGHVDERVEAAPGSAGYRAAFSTSAGLQRAT